MHKKPLDGVSVKIRPLLHLDLARRAIGTAANSTNRAGTVANRNGLAAACALGYNLSVSLVVIHQRPHLRIAKCKRLFFLPAELLVL